MRPGACPVNGHDSRAAWLNPSSILLVPPTCRRRRRSPPLPPPLCCRAVAEVVCQRWRRVLSRPDTLSGVVEAKFTHDRSRQLPAFCAWLQRRLGSGGTVANLAAARMPRPLPPAELCLQLSQPPTAPDAATNMMSLAMLLGAAGSRLTGVDLQLSTAFCGSGGGSGSSGALQLDILCLPLSAATRLAIQAPAIDLSDGLAHLTGLQELCLEYDSLTSRVGTPASCNTGRTGGGGHSPSCNGSTTAESSSALGCSPQHGCSSAEPQPLLRLPTGLTRVELLGCPEPGFHQPLPQLRHLFSSRHTALLDLDLSYNSPASCDDLAGFGCLNRLQRLVWRGAAG